MAEEADATEKQKMLLALAIAVALVGGIAWTIMSRPGLSQCEDAIKATLKAPSTYRRISVSGSRGTSFFIEYDAENSFGVPLRGQGDCRFNGDRAVWNDMSSVREYLN